MRRWRVPLVLSLLVVLARLAPQSPLLDVVTERAPAGVHLAYPLGHVLLAPLTLLADWLNGGSTADLKGFALWALVVIVIVRLWTGGQAGRRAGGLWLQPLLSVAGVVAFLAWAIYVPRPIPRLVSDAPDDVVVDIHSHTSASHDGRHGFGAAASAAWHARAGFDAAFVTDHNVVGAAHQWQTDAPGRPPKLLLGEELSLYGLHVVVLGNDTLIPNVPANASWDATTALLRTLANADSNPSAPFLVASLPEYWRNHWGPDLQGLVASGVRGFEIWTSSPKAMDIPAPLRRHVVARARLSNLVPFGATDMHGLGHTASVWNVTTLPGWRAMPDSALTAALLAHWRSGGFTSNRVMALRRWLPTSRAGLAVAVPVNVLGLPRRASHRHAAALLGWIWTGALVSSRRRARTL